MRAFSSHVFGRCLDDGEDCCGLRQAITPRTSLFSCIHQHRLTSRRPGTESSFLLLNRGVCHLIVRAFVANPPNDFSFVLSACPVSFDLSRILKSHRQKVRRGREIGRIGQQVFQRCVLQSAHEGGCEAMQVTDKNDNKQINLKYVQ